MNTSRGKTVKPVRKDVEAKNERDNLIETTMKDHKRLMRMFNKQKLQNRINNMRKKT